MRYVQKVTHIIEGKSVVQQFREDCPRCNYLNKRNIKVAMGPVSSDNLKIAPAFYVTQVDLCGPFKSYTLINKRATTKLCPVTNDTTEVV